MRFIIFYQFIRSSINDSKIELFTTEYEKFVNIVRDIFLKANLFFFFFVNGWLKKVISIKAHCLRAYTKM